MSSKTDPALWPHEYAEVIWEIERDRLEQAAKERADQKWRDEQREFFEGLAGLQ